MIPPFQGEINQRLNLNGRYQGYDVIHGYELPSQPPSNNGFPNRPDNDNVFNTSPGSF